MYKRIRGFFTVEAVYLVPIILLLYVLVIVGGFYLYDRCVISQDCYLLAFRTGQFTDSAANYGKIIYADLTEEFDESYVRERFAYKSKFYPYSVDLKYRVYKKNEVMNISVSGFQNLLSVKKSVPCLNPIKIIRSVRGQSNGSEIP